MYPILKNIAVYTITFIKVYHKQKKMWITYSQIVYLLILT